MVSWDQPPALVRVRDEPKRSSSKIERQRETPSSQLMGTQKRDLETYWNSKDHVQTLV